MRIRLPFTNYSFHIRHPRHTELTRHQDNYPTQPSQDICRDFSSATSADSDHASLITKLAHQRQAARTKLYALFDDRFEAACKKVVTLDPGVWLTHAGHITCEDDFENRPTFFSRMEADHQFYLERYEGAGLAHVTSKHALHLVTLGELNMASDSRMHSFWQAVPSFALSPEEKQKNDLERNKNLAFAEWAAIRFKPGNVHGWWRGKHDETEDILLISPREHLDFKLHETAEAYHTRLGIPL